MTTTTDEAPPTEQAIPTTEDAAEPEGSVTITAPSGSLTLDPTQTKLTPDQAAALAAITNADPNAARTWPHLRVFLHTCQRMALDPWRKQAYLIARGQGDNTKFTIQVGIDGYRTVAARTRLIIGSATWLWTGTDDDDKSWRFNEATGVMQRVWFDEWPESRGYPGAAKAVIRHYDAMGNTVVSDAVAHWGMYAPFYPKTEWVNRQKRNVLGDDGKQVMELGEMWAKGPAHMLAKCAEALVLRKVFPDEFAGTVTFEEMARADMEERHRREREQAAARKAAFAAAKAGVAPAAQQVAVTPDAASTPAQPADPASDAQGATEPVAVGEVLDEEAATAAWLTELAWQADTVGSTPAALAKRFVAARRQNVEDFPLDALAPMVHGFRPMLVERLASSERKAEAERYRQWAESGPAPIEDIEAVLSGTVGEDAGEPEPIDAEIIAEGDASDAPSAPETDAAPTDADPAAEAAQEPVQPPQEGDGEVDGPHAFVRKGRSPECAAPGCGFYADDPIHTVPGLDDGAGD